jgi:hypothetical protein
MLGVRRIVHDACMSSADDLNALAARVARCTRSRGYRQTVTRDGPTGGGLRRFTNGRVEIDLICDWYAEYMVREQSGQEVPV